MFKDGEHLRTPALERVIDTIAQSFPGFFFGRFDVRYADPETLRRGEGFRIVELNGVTSESTNIYDPDWSLLRAYRTLFRQWAIAYRIGAAVRRAGRAPIGMRRLLGDIRRFYRGYSVSRVSD